MKYHDLPEDYQIHLNALFNPENPLSLTCMLPKDYPEVWMDLLTKEPHVIPLLDDEDGLLKELANNHSYWPTVTDHRVRFAMWNEYENALLEGRKMIPANIHNLALRPDYFRALFLKDYKRAAFLLTKPAAYQAAMKETLLHGMKRLREILDKPDVDSKGRPDTKMLALKVKIVSMIDMRLHGAYTQKIHQINQNLPTAGQEKDLQGLIQKGDMKAIQNRIAEVDREIRKLSGEPAEKVPEPVAIEMEAE